MAHVDLISELRVLYRAAGRPSFRRISSEIREREDMPDTVSHETVSALINGTVVPRWSKVECVVRQLATMAVHKPDVEVEVRRFFDLWSAGADQAGEPDPVASRPATPAKVAVTEDLLPVGLPLSTDSQLGSIPARNPLFTGRENLLRLIRARLDGEPWQPLVLHGLSGMGKTSAALEYVHRVRDQYDLVWWIVAEQASQARSSLAALGERRDWPASQDMRQTIAGVLSRLESANFSWLLVFDNAAGPEEIKELVPAAGGSVIITTRDGDWLERGRAVPVDVLARADSIGLIRSRCPVTFDQADQLAERLGDLPLALEQAVAMMLATGVPVADYLARLSEHAIAVLSQGRPSDYPETVAGTLGVAFTHVRRESAGAAQLLELLSCLSAEPVSVTLLQAADEQVVPPPLGRLLSQDSSLQQAIRLLRRFGLIKVIGDGQRVEIHRLVQLIVRDSLTDLEREQAYSNARRLLVAANPGRPDDKITWEMHAEIGPHLHPADMVATAAAEVRQVVLDHARYLFVLGDYDGSRRISEEARVAWAGAEDVWDNEQVFACIDRLANALVGLGRYKEAGELIERAWERVRTHVAFGEAHTRTARLAATVAVIRRILGRYGEALELERFRADFYQRNGNPELLQANANLAVSLRMIGDFAQAREIDEAIVEARRRTEGDTNYRTLFAISNMARDLYGLGEYAAALHLQEESFQDLRAALSRRHPYVILADRTIALGLRKIGRLTQARDRSSEHLNICRGEFGSNNGHTLAAAMTYANAMRIAVAAGLGEPADSYSRAHAISLDTVNRYRRWFGEHNPLTLVAATNQAAILRAMGERRRARRIGEPAYKTLYQQLGAAHPYARAAAVGLANDLTAAHEEEDAARLLQATLEAARWVQQEDHPDMLICGANLGLIIRESDPATGNSMVETNVRRLREALGGEHPPVLAISRGERGECEIEPPPF